MPESPIMHPPATAPRTMANSRLLRAEMSLNVFVMNELHCNVMTSPVAV
jgi:hypothetical protein